MSGTFRQAPARLVKRCLGLFDLLFRRLDRFRAGRQSSDRQVCLRLADGRRGEFGCGCRPVIVRLGRRSSCQKVAQPSLYAVGLCLLRFDGCQFRFQYGDLFRSFADLQVR